MDDAEYLPLVEALQAKGQAGTVDYKIGGRKTELQASVNDALVKALLKYNGDWNISAHKPILGGDMNLNASSNNGNRAYSLQFQRKF